MTPVYGSSAFFRSVTGASGPTGPLGLTGTTGPTGGTIRGATGPTAENFFEILSSSAGLTFVTLFDGFTFERGISATYSPLDGSQILGNTGQTITNVTFENLGSGFTFAQDADENVLSIRGLRVEGEYLSLIETPDNELELDYNLSGSAFADASGLTGQLIKTNSIKDLVGVEGAKAQEFSNRNEVRGFTVKSYREPTILLEPGNGLEIDQIEGKNGIRATIDWSKGNNFLIDMTQYSGVTDGDAPLVVDIVKAPQDYTASFFLIVDGATGTTPSVDRFTSSGSSVKFPYIKEPCFSTNRDVFTFLSFQNTWYGNLVSWNQTQSFADQVNDIVPYKEAHYCNEFDPYNGIVDDGITGACCLGDGVTTISTFSQCPGFFVSQEVAASFGFTPQNIENACGTPTSGINGDAVGPCCVYQIETGDLECLNDQSPDQCLSLANNSDIYGSFSNFNDYLPNCDINQVESGCECVDCGNSIFGIGACCDGNGNCSEVSKYTCEQIGGFFRGSGIICTDTLCSGGSGACYTNGSCVDGVDATACINFGSLYAGDNSSCATTEQPGTFDPDGLYQFYEHPDIEPSLRPGQLYGGGIVVGIFNPYGALCLGNTGHGIERSEVNLLAQNVIDVLPDGTTRATHIPEGIIANESESGIYRSQYDFHGYGFNDKKNQSYFQGLSYPDDETGEIREDAWFIILALEDVAHPTNTNPDKKLYRWGLTGSNYGVITNVDQPRANFDTVKEQRYLDIDIREGFNGIDNIEGGALHGGEFGGYFRPIFSTKEGHWRQTTPPDATNRGLPVVNENLTKQSVTDWSLARSTGTSSLEKLYSKVSTGGFYTNREELGPDYNGLWHRNWGLYNTVRMAHALVNSRYKCGVGSTDCNQIYDYISPDGRGTITCQQLDNQSDYACGCLNSAVDAASGLLIGCDNSNDPGVEKFIYSSWPQDPQLINASQYYFADTEFSLLSKYNRPMYIGEYWFGNPAARGQTGDAGFDITTAVYGLRTQFDDRLYTENQSCPDNYCVVERNEAYNDNKNYIYPNPPFMSPWYIPSPDELAFIARRVAIGGLNTLIANAGGEPMEGEYWTSAGAFDFVRDQGKHVENPEGLLFSTIPGVTGETGTAAALYVGITFDFNDNRIHHDTGNIPAIKGHMTKAWTQEFPGNPNPSLESFGFKNYKRDKSDYFAKVRGIRLMRVDGRYPKTFYDRNNPTQSGSYSDANARLWYMPYVTRVFANDTNLYHGNYRPTSSLPYTPANIFENLYFHREYGTPEAGDPQGGGAFTGDLYGSCTLPDGSCSQRERYECVNYYGGDFGGEGSFCPRERAASYDRPVEPTGIKYVEEYSKERFRTGQELQNIQQEQQINTTDSSGVSSTQRSSSMSPPPAVSPPTSSPPTYGGY